MRGAGGPRFKTNDSLHTYAYDAENRIKTMDTTAATYSYLGALRVKKVVGSTTTVYVFSGSKVLAEYANGVLSKEYVYAGSSLLATVAGATTTYSYPDHLSTRVEADANGAVTRTFGHYPFGEAWYETGTASKWKFTSYERDAESGLDQAIFRYDSSRLGRFMSPDPVAGNILAPQSLNRYSYVLNDPVNLIDPLGLRWVCWTSYVWILEPVLVPDSPENPGGGEHVEYRPKLVQTEVCGQVHDPGEKTAPGGGGGRGREEKPLPANQRWDCIQAVNAKFWGEGGPTPPTVLEALGLKGKVGIGRTVGGILFGLAAGSPVGGYAAATAGGALALLATDYPSYIVESNRDYDKAIAECKKKFPLPGD